MKTRLTGVSFGLALAAAIFLLVWPAYTGFNGKQTSNATSLQVNGPSILIPVNVSSLDDADSLAAP
jgi:hypothetical protein